MNKGRSFIIVFLVSAVSWVLLGYVLRLFFPSISIFLFLIIGLIAGVFLGALLIFMREDVSAQPTGTESDRAVNPDNHPDLRPNTSSKK